MIDPDIIGEMLANEASFKQRIAELEAAIRKHMNMRGDDRCYLDDHELYLALPEGDTRPAQETAVTLANCERYIACRQLGREYISPQRRIEELEADMQRLREDIIKVGHHLADCVEILGRLAEKKVCSTTSTSGS